MRSKNKTADALLDIKYPILDHGFVSLVDYLGGDQRIAEAAWVSTMDEVSAEKKTPEAVAKIINYMMREKHSSPFEQVELVFRCKMPIFVARQWVRHRTACLSANTVLHFDLPGGIERRGNQLYKLTVGEVFEKFQPTDNKTRPDKQKNPYFKRNRVQQMMLRCVNEETGAVQHTQIVDIWESGIKFVYRVETASGAWAIMSADHACWSNRGWLRLKELVDLRNGELAWDSAAIHVVGPGKNTGVIPQFNPIDEVTEIWTSVAGWEGMYEVSDQGRIRRVAPGRGASIYKCKKLTISNGHAVVSLSRHGQTITKSVHCVVLESFVGPEEHMEVCHSDGNGLNNRLDNLRWGTPASNANDRVRDGATTSLRCYADEIVKVSLLREEMTYDLEVSGPWHNFSANGLIVHNSLNEMSGRYRVLPSESYIPTYDRMGGKGGEHNKQGTEGELLLESKQEIAQKITAGQEAAWTDYAWLNDAGLCNELARINLPLAAYTEWYWKIDLHNFFHFCALRRHAHAQWEIRQYANKMYELARAVAPWACDAFEEYRFNAVTLSQREVLELKGYLRQNLVSNQLSKYLKSIFQKLGIGV